MPPKRAYNKKKRTTYRKYGGKARVLPAVRTLQAVARRAVVQQLKKNIETKMSCLTATDGTEIFHNNFQTLSSTLLATTQGTGDPTTSNNANRIGDSINLQGVAIKMMIELNERYSDCTFRLMIVKCAKGDLPTRATLFNGLSGNKMLDTFNTERYTKIYQRYFKIKAPNNGSTAADGAGGAPQPSGYGTGTATFSRATKLIKLWIPGKAITKSGVLTYENGSSQPKFFDYHVLLYAYSNYTTLQDTWYVARVNDFISVMYFKDA